MANGKKASISQIVNRAIVGGRGVSAKNRFIRDNPPYEALPALGKLRLISFAP